MMSVTQKSMLPSPVFNVESRLAPSRNLLRTGRVGRLWLLLCYTSMMALLLGAHGCGSNEVKEDEELEPAELLEFNAEIGFRKIWSRSTGKGQGKHYNSLHPVFAGQHIIVAAVDGSVTSLDRETGSKNWLAQLNQQISGGVGISTQHAYVGTHKGDVIALRLDDGSQAWKVRLSSEILAAPTAKDNLVVVHTFDGKLYGLDTKTGEQRWVHEGNLPVLTMRGSSSAIFFEKLVIVGMASGKLIALHSESGQLVWERRVAIAQGRSEIERIIDVDSSPLLLDNVIYVVSYQGRIMAFQAASGRPIWGQDESSFNNLAEGYGKIYVSSSNSSLSAYGKLDGKLRWEQSELARRQITAPTTIDRYVAVGDFEGYIHVMSQHDGHLVARGLVDQKGIRSPMLVAKDQLYVYGNSGRLSMFRLTSDPRKSSFNTVIKRHQKHPPHIR